MDDLISRQAAIDAHYEYCNKHPDAGFPVWSLKILENLPSAQPEPCEDAVSRKAVEEMLKNGFPARGMWEIEGDVVKQTVCETLADALMDLGKLPSVQPETNCSEIPNNWIPCSERLPEEDVEVLISYCYKEGEGDTSHIDMDITTYGQMYFGGNKVGNRKHWRAPFEYFESNYEVVAWMPLPEPYAERREE